MTATESRCPLRLHLGWQYATLYPDPGPAPRRPAPPERERLSPGWLAAQRRAERLLNRPLQAACVVLLAVIGLMLLGGSLGWVSPPLAALIAGLAAVPAGFGGNAIWQGRRALRSRIDAEQRRVAAIQAESERRLFDAQAEHAAQVRAWQACRIAYQHQKHWYAVAAPADAHRADIVGGTLAGWAALLATSAAYQLAEGAEVTVIDLTGAAVAVDLLAFARSGRSGQSEAAGQDTAGDPGFWLLPADLARFDLSNAIDAGRSLDGKALADVLATAVNAAGGHDGNGSGTLPVDQAILERIISELAAPATVGGVAAGLRVLAHIGDPADDVASGLISQEQADRLRVMFGRAAADRVVTERALAMESQLRTLAPAGTQATAAPGQCIPGQRTPGRGRLRVIAVDQAAGVLDGKVLGCFVTVALTHLLRQADRADQADQADRADRAGQEGQRRPAWQHTVYLLGADSLPGEILDRLSDACERSRTGLVLGYRAMAPQVKQRLGRGDAVVGFMRLGNAEDAKAAAEQIGTEHRFVLAQLTETVGRSVTEGIAASYTGTAGQTSSVTASRSASDSMSVSSGRSHSGTGSQHSDQLSRSQSDSHGASDSVGISVGISDSTAWGQTTSASVSSSESLASSVQRSREFLVEPHELQRLPASAMIVSHAGPAGREVVLTDVNPGIGALSGSTMLSLAEARTMPSALAEASTIHQVAAEQPNLGPPPPRLDWRRGAPQTPRTPPTARAPDSR